MRKIIPLLLLIIFVSSCRKIETDGNGSSPVTGPGITDVTNPPPEPEPEPEPASFEEVVFEFLPECNKEKAYLNFQDCGNAEEIAIYKDGVLLDTISQCNEVALSDYGINYGSYEIKACPIIDGQEATGSDCSVLDFVMEAPPVLALNAACSIENNQVVLNPTCTNSSGSSNNGIVSISGDYTGQVSCNDSVTVPMQGLSSSYSFEYVSTYNDTCEVKVEDQCSVAQNFPAAAVLAPEKGCDAGDAKLKLTSCEVGKQYQVTINGSAQIHTCTGNDEFSLGGYGNHSVEVCAYLNGQSGNCVSDTYNMPAPTQYALTASCGEINDNNQMAVNFNCTAGSANGTALPNTLTVSGDVTDSFACNGSMVKNYTVPSGQTDLSLNFNYGANSTDGCVVKPSQLACNKTASLPPAAVLAPEKGCDAGDAKLKLTSCEVGKQYKVTINGATQLHTCTGNDEFSLGGYGNHSVEVCSYLNGQSGNCVSDTYNMPAPTQYALTASCGEINDNNQMVVNFNCTAGSANGTTLSNTLTVSGDATDSFACNGSMVKNYTLPAGQTDLSLNFNYGANSTDGCVVKPSQLACNKTASLPPAAVLAPEKGCDAGDAKLKLTSCEVGKQYQVTINGATQLHTCTGNDEFSLGGYGNHSVEVCSYLNGQSGNCVSDTYNMPAPTQYAMTASCGEIDDNNQMAVNFNCTAGSANGTTLSNTLTVSGDATDSFACNGAVVKNYTVPAGQTDLSLNFNYGASSNDGCVVKPEEISCSKDITIIPPIVDEKNCAENYLEIPCNGSSEYFTISGCLSSPMHVRCSNSKARVNLHLLAPGNYTCNVKKTNGPHGGGAPRGEENIEVTVNERSASCDAGCKTGPVLFEPTKFSCIASSSNQDPTLVFSSPNLHAFISTGGAGASWQPISIANSHNDWINPDYTIEFDFSNTTCSTAERYIAVCSDRTGSVDQNLSWWYQSSSLRYESGLVDHCPDGTGLLGIYKVNSDGATTNVVQGGRINYYNYHSLESSCLSQGFYYSPLMLNYLGDGVEFTNNLVEKDGTDKRMLFDIDADGKKEYISCPKNKGTVFIVKPNEDNEVVDANQLFGDKTKIDGHMFANGFDALAYYDTNNDADEGIADGVFNSKDPEYSNLRLWEELNCNGVIDEGELHSLEEKGVHEIVVQKDGSVSSVLAGSEEDVDVNYSGYREYNCDYGNGNITYCMDNYRNQSRLKSVYRTKDQDGNMKTNQIFDIFFFDPSPGN